MERAAICLEQHQRDDYRLDQQDFAEQKRVDLPAREQSDRPGRALQDSQHVGFESVLYRGVTQVVADFKALVNARRAPKPLHRDARPRRETALSREENVELYRTRHQTADAED